MELWMPFRLDIKSKATKVVLHSEYTKLVRLSAGE